VAQIGKVRRAKLYYLRDLSGKKARIFAEERGWEVQPQQAAPEISEAPPAAEPAAKEKPAGEPKK
jgi:hypothetical protein